MCRRRPCILVNRITSAFAFLRNQLGRGDGGGCGDDAAAGLAMLESSTPGEALSAEANRRPPYFDYCDLCVRVLVVK